ncbi:hypothetical protein [Paraburkholderia pallida]|uniref:Uncharacterized protein n=1 Tax=Paraburkholderia pallida TaxID=2547399 RepID=A0A4P7D5Q0_9BURK|nr:hypothetical protein [Paraburkholderia pallida]QBR02135.1 hypothetical protein E1956_34050 [Paraburkholderia pallida]
MTSSSMTGSKLYDLAMPVFDSLENQELRATLIEVFSENIESLKNIEQVFVELTSQAHSKDALRSFFNGWTAANASIASVSGLANRVTLEARRQDTPGAAQQLFDVCYSLQRISDEDLGVFGGRLHSDLFHTMATTVCSDEQWMLKEYSTPSAREFKAWRDSQRLGENLLNAMLLTLAHEIFTHAEVEFIQPLFQDWFTLYLELPPEKVSVAMAWVNVHTGGTESTHFFHAVDALEGYAAVTGLTIDRSQTKKVFRDYLSKRSIVMSDLATAFWKDEAACI